MKNIIKYLSVAVLAMTFASCGNNAEYTVLEDQAFIAQTNTNGNSSQKLTLGNDPISTTINVRLSSPAEDDYAYQLLIDEEALEAYNKLNSTSYNVLPEEFYSFSSTTVEVLKGQAVSEPVHIFLTPLSAEVANSGLKYAIPVRLVSMDGKGNILESGSVMIYEVDRVVIQPVVMFDYWSHLIFTLPEEQYEFTEWTVEMNLNMSKLGTSVGSMNNQAIFDWARPESGGDSEIYIRFGDAPIKGNILQCKTQGTQMNSNMEFSANTWYHIAIVCSVSKLYYYVNGELDNSIDLPGKPYKFANTVKSGATTYFKATAMMGEFRIWTKARTQSEIANNMYSCDPESAGLVAYFKLDEGEGQTFTDCRNNGGTGRGNDDIEWVQDVRLDGKAN